ESRPVSRGGLREAHGQLFHVEPAIALAEARRDHLRRQIREAAASFVAAEIFDVVESPAALALDDLLLPRRAVTRSGEPQVSLLAHGDVVIFDLDVVSEVREGGDGFAHQRDLSGIIELRAKGAG